MRKLGTILFKGVNDPIEGRKRVGSLEDMLNTTNQPFGKHTQQYTDGSKKVTQQINSGPQQLNIVREIPAETPIFAEIVPTDCPEGFLYSPQKLLALDNTVTTGTTYKVGTHTYYSTINKIFLSWNGGNESVRYARAPEIQVQRPIYSSGIQIATAPVRVYGVGYNAQQSSLLVAGITEVTNEHGLLEDRVVIYRATATLLSDNCLLSVNENSWELLGSVEYPGQEWFNKIITIIPFNASGTKFTYCVSELSKTTPYGSVIEVNITFTDGGANFTPTIIHQGIKTGVTFDVSSDRTYLRTRNWSWSATYSNCTGTDWWLLAETDDTTVTQDWTIIETPKNIVNPSIMYFCSDYIENTLVHGSMIFTPRDYTTTHVRSYDRHTTSSNTYDPCSVGAPITSSETYNANFSYSFNQVVTEDRMTIVFSAATGLSDFIYQNYDFTWANTYYANYTAIPIGFAVMQITGFTYNGTIVYGSATRIVLLDLREQMLGVYVRGATLTGIGSVDASGNLNREIDTTTTLDITSPYYTVSYPISSVITYDVIKSSASWVITDVNFLTACDGETDPVSFYDTAVSPVPPSIDSGSCSIPYTNETFSPTFDSPDNALTILSDYNIRYSGIPQKNSSVLTGSYGVSGVITKTILNGIEVHPTDEPLPIHYALGSYTSFL